MSAKPHIRNYLRPLCLVGLFIIGTLSLNCNFLNVHLRRVTWKNLSLLSNMSNSLPEECLREKKAFALPKEVLLHTQSVKRDIKEAFYEISIQAFNIFSQYTVKSSWEEQHLRQIQAGLGQQLQYLKQCLEEEEKENKDLKAMEGDEIRHSKATVPQLSSLELKKYFARIDKFLKGKKYSHCAWKIVLIEVRRCFYYYQKSTALHMRK
ncbi:PREDICTED: interferon kappa [Condylura cristata]|uniref:interferon kappa n=1 Tax=Condylura cristata TaxID=143302 RepID=UPI0003345BCE|nr:PREDICTED: interferon kappa [Condylura cristata]